MRRLSFFACALFLLGASVARADDIAAAKERPLDPVDVREGEVVELAIPAASWEEDLEELLRERAAVSGRFSAEEVEQDVLEAIAEVREQQRGTP